MPVTINETELLLSRSGYTARSDIETVCTCKRGGRIVGVFVECWQSVWLETVRRATMQTLRLEKAYPLYGNDINEEVTPFHVGLDRWIRFDKRSSSDAMRCSRRKSAD